MNIPDGYTEYDGSGQPAETIGRNVHIVLRLGFDTGNYIPPGVPADDFEWAWGVRHNFSPGDDDIVAYKLVGEEL